MPYQKDSLRTLREKSLRPSREAFLKMFHAKTAKKTLRPQRKYIQRKVL